MLILPVNLLSVSGMLQVGSLYEPAWPRLRGAISPLRENWERVKKEWYDGRGLHAHFHHFYVPDILAQPESS